MKWGSCFVPVKCVREGRVKDVLKSLLKSLLTPGES